MTSQTTPAPSRSFGISILFKCLLILTAAILTVASVLTYNADRKATSIALDGLRYLARNVTELTAGQLEGAVRFRKADSVDASIRSLLEKHPDAIASILVLDKENGVMAQAGASVGPDLRRLAETAKLTLAGGVFFIVLIAAGLFFRLSLAAPLTRVARRTAEMSKGDLVSDILGQNRRDEIGLLSRELDTLRAQLHAAEAVTQDAHFKSAGFLGSSAALSMTDPDLKLTHHNTAFKSFIKSAGPSLLKDKDVTSAKNLVGADLSEAFRDDGAIRSMISKETSPSCAICLSTTWLSLFRLTP